MKKELKIDCFKCRHFYITWDKQFPYGCRGIGFKSKGLPAAQVLRTSGMECLKFSRATKDKNS